MSTSGSSVRVALTAPTFPGIGRAYSFKVPDGGRAIRPMTGLTWSPRRGRCFPVSLVGAVVVLAAIMTCTLKTVTRAT